MLVRSFHLTHFRCCKAPLSLGTVRLHTRVTSYSNWNVVASVPFVVPVKYYFNPKHRRPSNRFSMKGNSQPDFLTSLWFYDDGVS